MADKPAAERTEQPTARRLSKAKEKGQLPRSQELSSFVCIAVLLTALVLMAPTLMHWFEDILKSGLSGDRSVLADPGAFTGFFRRQGVDFLLLILPIMAALSAGAIVTGVVISGGFNYTPGAVKFDLAAISPGSGLNKLFNVQSMVRLGISIVKLAFIILIAWFFLQTRIEELARLRWTWSMGLLAGILSLICGLVIRVCVGLLIIGLIDMVFQKWKHIQDLKMTKQEVKEERKQTEGSPEVKNRIRRLQFEAALRRMTEEIPKADVVVVNPEHVAVALKYDAEQMQAPLLLVKGADHMAARIREIARAYGVPIIRRPQLARSIYATVKPGEPIPEHLYAAVAEVLALIYRLRKQKA